MAKNRKCNVNKDETMNCKDGGRPPQVSRGEGGDIPPYVWAITAAALVGALYVTFGQGHGGKGGRGGGEDGVYTSSQKPCPVNRGRGRGGQRQEADWEE